MKISTKALSVAMIILAIFITAIVIDQVTNKQVVDTDPITEAEEGVIDLRLPSDSTDGGTLAVRLYVPENPRYEEGAPVVVWVPGGYETKGVN